MQEPCIWDSTQRHILPLVHLFSLVDIEHRAADARPEGVGGISTIPILLHIRSSGYILRHTFRGSFPSCHYSTRVGTNNGKTPLLRSISRQTTQATRTGCGSVPESGGSLLLIERYN